MGSRSPGRSRYELWVAGSENDLRISVDRDDSLVHITGIPSRMPDLVVASDPDAVLARLALNR